MTSPAMHTRGELARAVDVGLGDNGVVMCGLGSASRAWRELESSRPAYYCSDPMGLALPFAAGFALARPGRDVALIVGDGDLLMGLGAVVGVGGAAPPNLHVLVLANRRYETGGGRALPGPSTLDIAGIVQAAGWSSAETAGPDLDGDIRRHLDLEGPALIVVPVQIEAAPYGGPGQWSGVEERVRFDLALAESDAELTTPPDGRDRS